MISITKVEISNYRSCLHCSFDLQAHLSVLIGPNGSGKTNVLNALLLLKRLVEEEHLRYYRDQKPTARPTLKIWFDLDGKKVLLVATAGIYTDENNNDVVVMSEQQWYMKDFTGSRTRLKIPLSFAKHFQEETAWSGEYRFSSAARQYIFRFGRKQDVPASARRALAAIARLALDMRYYSASQFTNPGACPVSFEIEKEGRESRGVGLRGHAKFLFDLYTEFRARSKGYTDFFNVVGPDGIGLVDRIKFQEITTSSIDYSVRSGGKINKRRRDKMLVVPQFAVGKDELSPNQLSEGTLKTITLLFYLITEASSILLLEEPEVCIHHGLLSSIIELIKAYSLDKQVVLSTHSDFVLDHVSPANVYRVSRTTREGTNVVHIAKSMSKGEFAALRKYLEKEGNLGEYWRHGALES
jgi:energy-coupling factor transporter ATP-binding protein EcfA2